ncbi:hypothetical protein T12_13148 [Trichinella patagoniensis]|uniref:Uncharacterized protein n=1 Tax=Trichinella patagoniensis TaxID=990121 RepID=A0A0V0ZNI1_9BILA|nr:hypothetical protein T12_13148 [Trichinella patagoniensis]
MFELFKIEHRLNCTLGKCRQEMTYNKLVFESLSKLYAVNDAQIFIVCELLFPDLENLHLNPIKPGTTKLAVFIAASDGVGSIEKFEIFDYLCSYSVN